MAYQNISAELTDPDKAAVLQHVTDINGVLPFLVNLTMGERSTLPKMGDGSQTFVSKALTYAENNPNIVPPYVNIPELRKDFNLAMQMVLVCQQLKQVAESADDTCMALGSEAFLTALAVYNSAKQAARMNVPGADAIYQDLKQRFPGGPQQPPTPPTP